MPKAPLFDANGERIGMVELPREIFGFRPKAHVLWEVTRMYLANRRRGTHKAKTRAEVTGSGAKIWPQKGMGRARHGSRKAPIFVGGGKAHGPRPRDYSFSVPKKVKRLAFFYALSDRAMSSRVYVFKNFEFKEPKTKRMVELLKKIGLEGRKVLFMPSEYDRNLYLSGRNISKVSVKTTRDANALDVLNADYLITDERSFEILKERLP